MGKDFTYILIDCHPNFDLLTQNAIISSDYYIIPTKFDYLFILGIDTLNSHINKLLQELSLSIQEFNFKGYDSKPRLLGVVGNMVNIKKGNELVAINSNSRNLIKPEYKIFDQSLRNNPEMMDMQGLIPAVLKKNYSNTQKAVVNELNMITKEFKERIRKGI